jgi:hypothetical protein
MGSNATMKVFAQKALLYLTSIDGLPPSRAVPAHPQVVPTSYTPLGVNKTTISSNQFSVVGVLLQWRVQWAGAGTHSRRCNLIRLASTGATPSRSTSITDAGSTQCASQCEPSNDSWLTPYARALLNLLSPPLVLLRLRTSVRPREDNTHCRVCSSSMTSHPSR